MFWLVWVRVRIRSNFGVVYGCFKVVLRLFYGCFTGFGLELVIF